MGGDAVITPVVGKSYLTGANATVTIIKENKGLGWPFVADDGEHYDHDGRAYHGSHMDLKKEVKLPVDKGWKSL